MRCDPSCQRRPSSTRLSNASVCKFPHRLRSSDRSIGKGDLKKKKIRRKRGRLSIFIHVPTIDPRRLANAITSQASIVIKADGDEKGEDVPPADRPPRLNFSREKRAVAKSVRGGEREREAYIVTLLATAFSRQTCPRFLPSKSLFRCANNSSPKSSDRYRSNFNRYLDRWKKKREKSFFSLAESNKTTEENLSSFFPSCTRSYSGWDSKWVGRRSFVFPGSVPPLFHPGNRDSVTDDAPFNSNRGQRIKPGKITVPFHSRPALTPTFSPITWPLLDE